MVFVFVFADVADSATGMVTEILLERWQWECEASRTAQFHLTCEFQTRCVHCSGKIVPTACYVVAHGRLGCSPKVVPVSEITTPEMHDNEVWSSWLAIDLFGSYSCSDNTPWGAILSVHGPQRTLFEKVLNHSESSEFNLRSRLPHLPLRAPHPSSA